MSRNALSDPHYMAHVQETIKHVGDWTVTGLTLGVLMEWITPIVAIFNGVYILFRLYELIERRVKYGGLKQDQSE